MFSSISLLLIWPSLGFFFFFRIQIHVKRKQISIYVKSGSHSFFIIIILKKRKCGARSHDGCVVCSKCQKPLFMWNKGGWQCHNHDVQAVSWGNNWPILWSIVRFPLFISHSMPIYEYIIAFIMFCCCNISTSFRYEVFPQKKRIISKPLVSS